MGTLITKCHCFVPGLITAVVPMYLTEMAPLRLRGAMGVLCALGVTFGVLVGQVMSLREILGKKHIAFLISIWLLQNDKNS